MKRRVAAQAPTGGVERGSTVGGPPSDRPSEQYSLAKILGIWALAAARWVSWAGSFSRYLHQIPGPILSDRV